MRCHRIALVLAALLFGGPLGPAGAEPGRSDAAGVPTGRFTLTVPAARADAAAISARVAEQFGEARLVGTRNVMTRGGPGVGYVFELPREQSVRKYDDLARALRRVGRDVGGDGAEELRRRAKGKPVNLPIFEGDWNARTVRTQPALDRTTAYAAQAKATGKGQIVAVLDGGFDLGHEFLAGHLAPEGYDALDDDADPQDLGNGANDDAAFELPGEETTDRVVGHGTFVSSIVLAVAPDVTILPVRVLDDEGWGTDLALASGITYAVEHGARVINLSLVIASASQLVRDAVRAAYDAGVVVVVASGSTDDGWQSDPYLTKRWICVGATDDDDVVAPWSVTSSYVHVFAPGVDVRGALGGRATDAYGRWSGVSFAVPFLSAGAAMLREKHPDDWTAREVRDRLAAPSAPAWFPSGAHVMWRGRVDLNLSVPWN